MPKPGFKSITINERIYNKFLESYEKSKNNLELKGITSFSGYLTSLMEESLRKYEISLNHAPLMEKILVDESRAVIKDNKKNRIAEVILRNGELQCLLDESNDCAHIGFLYSLPELYRIMDRIKK